MIRCWLLFLMPFNVYKLMYKFWGRIWGQGDQNWGFWMKFEGVPERNPNFGFPVTVKLVIASNSSPSELLSDSNPRFWRSEPFWVILGHP